MRDNELFVVIHEHKFGQTLYPFRSSDIDYGYGMEKDLEEKLVKFLDIPFEEDNDEYLLLELINETDIKTYRSDD